MSAALARRWEARLRREGLPPEPRPLTRTNTYNTRYSQLGRSFVSLDVIREMTAASLGDAPITRYWALFAQAAHDLPASWGRRKRFLVAFGEVGIVRVVCREQGTRPDDAHLWLRQFAVWRAVNGC